MDSKTTAKVLPLIDLFLRLDWHFVVPEYQRSYQWRPEHAIALLEDTRSAFGNDEKYFLNSIILAWDGKEQESRAVLVDGQQRLITLTLILIVMRDLETEQRRRRDFESFIVSPGNLIAGTPGAPRLELSGCDRSFFRSHIQRAEGFTFLLSDAGERLCETDSHRRLRTNSMELRKHMESWSIEDRRRYAQWLVVNCSVVAICTQELESGIRIFSRINARGLPLSVADVLKADLYASAGSEYQRDAFARSWDEQEALLGMESFGKLLLFMKEYLAAPARAQRLLSATSEKERKRRSRELFEECYDRPLSLSEAREMARIGTETLMPLLLIPCAKAYHAILSEVLPSDLTALSSENAVRLKRLFHYLKAGRNTDWEAAAIVYLARFFEPRLVGNSSSVVLSGTHLLEFFTLVERTCSLLAFPKMGVVNQRKHSMFVKLLADLDAYKSILVLPEDSLQLCRDLICGDVYSSGLDVRFLLLRLNDEMTEPSQVSFNFGVRDISVEHVLPQHLPQRSRWREIGWTWELHRRSVHKIGNLALLSRRMNQKFANKAFEEKKKIMIKFEGDAWHITHEMLRNEQFDPPVFKARHEKLVALALQMWGLTETAVDDGIEDSVGAGDNTPGSDDTFEKDEILNYSRDAE